MKNTQETAPVGAILKAFSVIRQLSEKNASLADISYTLGQPKTSVHRLLATLMELGIVDKDANDDYFLTSKLFEYGAKALDAQDLVSNALPSMRELRDAVGETVHFAVRRGESVIYLHKVESQHSLRMISRVGYHAPLYCTSLGKSLLAWVDEKELERIVSHIEFKPVMPNTITDGATLLHHLKGVRDLGYSCDDEENEHNVICFGAPIFDHYRQPLAAVSISMPMFRYSEEKKGEIVQALQSAAREISQKFGCTIWPPDRVDEHLVLQERKSRV